MRFPRPARARLLATLIAAAAVTGLITPMTAAAAPGATVPCIPTVQGPIRTTPSSKPYVPTAQQGTWPVASNYTVQEFFVSCTAPGQSWKTRILVRRPKSAAQFSGTVVTEVPDGSIWTDSYYTARYEMSAGIVSAMVESVPSFLDDTVIPSDPQRYASLHIPDVPGINYVIEAEIGALFKSGARDRVLPDLHVRHVIFSGFSGSAAEVRGYITAEHFALRMPGGGPIYDGYFPEQRRSAPIRSRFPTWTSR
ncbi:MAG TPA: alpha/beta hydrolase domain-containing protein [Pseudonocardiaceae bacterium]|nr:alpha/beta hydrolase domain-containing protein [Pseudonocardiaceae bacterium]